MEAVTAPPQTPTLDSPELYTNRELSWLKFNERVLELAEDETTPLLERVKFLAIYANNLDEFFMVRVAGLYDQVDAGIDARGPDASRRGAGPAFSVHLQPVPFPGGLAARPRVPDGDVRPGEGAEGGPAAL